VFKLLSRVLVALAVVVSAAFQLISDHAEARAVKRMEDGGELRQHLGRLAVLLDHVDHAAELTVHAPQPKQCLAVLR
jgi:hypothetical protein